jgi:replication-associated recombination protein RarA
MKFLNKLTNIRHSLHPVCNNPFDKIQDYDDLKEIVKRALTTDDAYNLLFCGPPASAKTLFLQAIIEISKEEGIYFDCTNTTNRILDVLEQERPKVICLDELEKMSRQFQEKLLNFLESGHVKVDQVRRQYDFNIERAKVFATCNDINRLSKPLQSRFRKLYLKRYSEEQFIHVAEKVLPKLSASVARYVGASVYRQGGDIRDCLSIGRLVKCDDGPNEIAGIMFTIAKYGTEAD